MAQKFLTDIEVTRGLVDSSGDLGVAGQVLSSTGSGTNWITNEANSTVVYLDEFTGDNSTVDFTLSVSVTDENITQVYIDGVYQNKDTYSVSGTTLTFSTAPPLNADIEVITFSTATTSDDLSAGSVIIPVKNTHTASIAKGEPVYITGNVGSSARLQIAPADASNSAKMPAAGLLLQTLAVNAEGYVITGGYLRNITTDTIDGTSTSSNDTVYVKSGGGLTMTKPTGTNLIQNIAKVARVASGSAGSLLVSSILRTNDVPNITNDYFWLGNSSGVATPTEFTSTARGLLSVGAEGTAAGDGNLAYNNSSGVFTYTPPVLGGLSGTTDNITEGSTNLYYTDARSRSSISAGGDLSYNSTTGVMSYTTPTTIASLSNHDTDDLSEGATNLYYTDTRVGTYLTTNNYLTASSTHTLTNKSGNISQWTNDSGYITDGNTNWNNSYGFITASSTETLTNKSGNISMFTNDSGYITDGNTNWDNSYGFITASSTDTLTNKSGNISMFTNDSGYITSFDITTQTDPKYLRSNAADTLSAAITLDNNGYFVGSPSYGFRFNNSGDTINALIVDNSGNSIAYASHRAPIFYDSNNTNRYINPDGASVLYTIQSTQAQASPNWDTAFYVLQAQHWYGDTSSQTMYLGQSSNTIQVPGSGGIRPKIVYDYDNTGFYLNPNGTSNLSTLSTDTNEGIFNNQRRNHGTTQNFNDTSLRAGINYLQQGTNGPTGTASHQWYGWRLGLGGDYGTQTGSSGHYAQEWYIARKGQGGNNTGGNFLWTRDMEGGSWGSWQKIDTDRLQLASGYSVVMGSWGLRNATPYGYIEMGPANSGHAHIYTDRSNFYFNQEIYINGGSYLRQNDIRAQIFYDLNDTGYYLDPASTSLLNNVTIAGGANGLLITNSDIRSSATSNWTGDPGGAGKIQYHSNRWYIVSDSSSNRIVQFRRNGSDKCYIDNDGRLMDVQDVRAYVYYDRDNTSYYTNPAGESVIDRLNRAEHHRGHFEGSYNNIGGNSQYTNPIYTIGSSYNPNSTTLGNMYGIGFAHPNLWGSGKTTDWGMYVAANGSFEATIGQGTTTIWAKQNIVSDTSVRAPIFYDLNNTGYYIDPASNSVMNTINSFGFSQSGGGNKILVSNSGGYLMLDNWVYVGGSGIYSGVNGAHLYPNQCSDYGAWRMNGTRGGWSGITFDVSGCNVTLMASSATMGFYNDADNEWMIESQRNSSTWLYHNGTWEFRTNAGYSEVRAQMRGPIFYDSNNTGYYVDPASWSNLSSGRFESYLQIGTTGVTSHTPGINMAIGSDIYWRQSTYSSNADVWMESVDNATYLQWKLRVSSFDTTSWTDSIVVFNHNFWRGYVGILRSPEYPLDLNGQARLSGGYTTSDVRLKKNIRDNELGLSHLLQLRTRLFDWITDEEILGRTLAFQNSLLDCRGFIAQEVEEVVPELVDTSEGDQPTKSIDDGAVTAMMVKAIQEQQAIIDDLKARIEILENN